MNWIAILIMKKILKKAKTDKFKKENEIVRQAYNNMIRSYTNAIMFLEADK